jgi:two-component system, LuxR family, response regulator FixJ
MDAVTALGVVRPRILLVEDDAPVRRSLQLALRAQGYEVRAYGSAVGLASDPEALHADCLVADLMLPDKNALELLQELRETGWSGPAILVSGYLSGDGEKQARSAGYAAVFSKPVRNSVLSRTISELLGRPQT